MDAMTKKADNKPAKNLTAAKQQSKAVPAPKAKKPKKEDQMARIEKLLLTLENEIVMLKARVRELEPETVTVPEVKKQHYWPTIPPSNPWVPYFFNVTSTYKKNHNNK
jgi:hypothetical protein